MNNRKITPERIGVEPHKINSMMFMEKRVVDMDSGELRCAVYAMSRLNREQSIRINELIELALGPQKKRNSGIFGIILRMFGND